MKHRLLLTQHPQTNRLQRQRQPEKSKQHLEAWSASCQSVVSFIDMTKTDDQAWKQMITCLCTAKHGLSTCYLIQSDSLRSRVYFLLMTLSLLQFPCIAFSITAVFILCRFLRCLLATMSVTAFQSYAFPLLFSE